MAGGDGPAAVGRRAALPGPRQGGPRPGECGGVGATGRRGELERPSTAPSGPATRSVTGTTSGAATHAEAGRAARHRVAPGRAGRLTSAYGCPIPYGRWTRMLIGLCSPRGGRVVGEDQEHAVRPQQRCGDLAPAVEPLRGARGGAGGRATCSGRSPVGGRGRHRPVQVPRRRRGRPRPPGSSRAGRRAAATGRRRRRRRRGTGGRRPRRRGRPDGGQRRVGEREPVGDEPERHDARREGTVDGRGAEPLHEVAARVASRPRVTPRSRAARATARPARARAARPRQHAAATAASSPPTMAAEGRDVHVLDVLLPPVVAGQVPEATR